MCVRRVQWKFQQSLPFGLNGIPWRTPIVSPTSRANRYFRTALLLFIVKTAQQRGKCSKYFRGWAPGPLFLPGGFPYPQTYRGSGKAPRLVLSPGPQKSNYCPWFRPPCSSLSPTLRRFQLQLLSSPLSFCPKVSPHVCGLQDLARCTRPTLTLSLHACGRDIPT